MRRLLVVAALVAVASASCSGAGPLVVGVPGGRGMSLLFDVPDGPLVDLDEYEASAMAAIQEAEAERQWAAAWEPHVHNLVGPNICVDCGWLT